MEERRRDGLRLATGNDYSIIIISCGNFLYLIHSLLLCWSLKMAGSEENVPVLDLWVGDMKKGSDITRRTDYTGPQSRTIRFNISSPDTLSCDKLNWCVTVNTGQSRR
ncbi:hypothetical protein RRG08_065248 [Elysia crispata]|uniref:Uncharacterized protein n=1 Tax=Elysia crispata TaxID=231223 RepID=A0AAE1CZI3_9GAST|nr:hypothetical protein RRG08_065248 [Elysia crispata]